MTPTEALAVATTVDVRTIRCTGTPQPCERGCGSQRGVVRVYTPDGLAHVCLDCALTVISRALDDSPPDAVVVVEVERYPAGDYLRNTGSPARIDPSWPMRTLVAVA